MTDVLMPRLSDSMEEGLIVTWLVDEGTEISQGEDLVEIETDKANMTFEADGNGLVHIVASEGDSLPVGALIAQLLGPGEEPTAGNDAGLSTTSPASTDHGQAEGNLSPTNPSPAVAASIEPEVEESGDAAQAASSNNSESTDSPGRRVKASPLARRLATDGGVELGALSGSGPGGRIVKADVERAIESRRSEGPPAGTATTTGGKGETEIVEISRLQQTVARRMSESKATIPHFYLSTEIDMGACVTARAGLKESAAEGAVVPSFNDMVVKASALALREFPKANGAWRDGHLELYSRINIGVAVAAQDALVVPVIPDADQLGLAAIATTTRELAAKVRDGSVTPPELSGGTFTVSNLGMFGVTDFNAVVNPGQAAILAVGSIEDRPVVRNGELVPGKMMGMTLSCDHRILYGAEGALFLARVKSMLEEPISLAL
ncbi:MAG: 2-oxo acid dehydrogenase subunit E2 [Solirubrobacterales bacterium]|nr:2-oxo acid dehydrogenase subunit E2 [Solirubrobacterales bacterium]OJU95337.1 MAG: hypothetical protein BGO23_05625 [Solirubrobacterales bacterium 67-14]